MMPKQWELDALRWHRGWSMAMLAQTAGELTRSFSFVPVKTIVEIVDETSAEVPPSHGELALLECARRKLRLSRLRHPPAAFPGPSLQIEKAS